mmetsp:Transcript_2017/g.7810  ORF Transcript_2017/g.7810 Transcript_2017/m.7810 type:complete len:359 (+) Transcript_2017:1018-2094(+)
MHTDVLSEHEGSHQRHAVCEVVQGEAVERSCERGTPSPQALSPADRVMEEKGYSLGEDQQPARIKNDGLRAAIFRCQALSHCDGQQQAEVGGEPAPAHHCQDVAAVRPDRLPTDVEVHIVIDDCEDLQHRVRQPEEQECGDLRDDDLTDPLSRRPGPPTEERGQHQGHEHERPEERHQRTRAVRRLEGPDDQVLHASRAQVGLRGIAEQAQAHQRHGDDWPKCRHRLVRMRGRTMRRNLMMWGVVSGGLLAPAAVAGATRAAPLAAVAVLLRLRLRRRSRLRVPRWRGGAALLGERDAAASLRLKSVRRPRHRGILVRFLLGKGHTQRRTCGNVVLPLQRLLGGGQQRSVAPLQHGLG